MNEHKNSNTEIITTYKLKIEELFNDEEDIDHDTENIIDKICSQPDLTLKYSLTEDENQIVFQTYSCFADMNFHAEEHNETREELIQKLETLLQIQEIKNSIRLTEDISKAIVNVKYNPDFHFYQDMHALVLDWMKLTVYWKDMFFGKR